MGRQVGLCGFCPSPPRHARDIAMPWHDDCLRRGRPAACGDNCCRAGPRSGGRPGLARASPCGHFFNRHSCLRLRMCLGLATPRTNESSRTKHGRARAALDLFPDQIQPPEQAEDAAAVDTEVRGALQGVDAAVERLGNDDARLCQRVRRDRRTSAPDRTGGCGLRDPGCPYPSRARLPTGGSGGPGQERGETVTVGRRESLGPEDVVEGGQPWSWAPTRVSARIAASGAISSRGQGKPCYAKKPASWVCFAASAGPSPSKDGHVVQEISFAVPASDRHHEDEAVGVLPLACRKISPQQASQQSLKIRVYGRFG